MPRNIPDLENIRKFIAYRKKGLTYREIAKLMDKQLRVLARWNKYVVDKKLSTKMLAE